MKNFYAYLNKDEINQTKPLLEALMEPFERIAQNNHVSVSVNGYRETPDRPNQLRAIVRVKGDDQNIQSFFKALATA